jgi:Holliday junction DNA helicase RuvA
MIEQLTGVVVRHSPTFLVLDVQGVGYGLHVSLPCASAHLLGAKASFPCYLAVREGAMDLYGFSDWTEKEVFLALITVSGIGPKLAQRVLSECTPAQFVDWIGRGNFAALTKLKGVGKKTAELMVLELKSKLARLQGTLGHLHSDLMAQGELSSPLVSPDQEEAFLALVALGLKDLQARKAVEAASKQLGADAELGALIATALRLA